MTDEKLITDEELGRLERAWPVDPHGAHGDDCHLSKHYSCAIARLSAALRREREAREWQPIDSAPRDGTNFLACSPASSVFLAHYANGVVDSSSWDEGAGYQERHATHWMKLPSPRDS